MSHDVAAALAGVKDRIEAAGRAADRLPGAVRLVAVSKRQPDEKLLAAYAAGHRDFGENYVQELERKRTLLPDDAVWHLIGPVQSKKARRAFSADLLHTVDRPKLVRAMSAAFDSGPPLDVLLQVNIACEATKSGVRPEAAATLLAAVRDAPGLRPRGLMCIPPPGEGARYFRALRSLRDRLETDTGMTLPELSMGMSDDFEAAIREGATLVRVGTAIFGPREDSQ